MRIRVLVLFCSAVASSLLDTGLLRIYPIKRLTSTTTIMTSSKGKCAAICLQTNCCLVASVTTVGDLRSCSLATGSIEENEVVDDVGSKVLVFGKSIYR